MVFSPNTRAYAGTQTNAAVMDQGLRAYMLRVYNWMASGLVLTGIVAYGIAHTQLINLFYRPVRDVFGRTMLQPTALGFISIFAPVAFVLVLQFGINRLSRTAAQALFWAYAAAMGASLTNIFLAYTQTSVVQVFFITAASFAGLSLVGYTTKRNLAPMASFCIMGVFGLLIAMLANAFLVRSTAFQMGISICGVLAFAGLTAYDTQRIKSDYVNYAYAMGADGAAKRSVMDALTLYLNFINIFLFLMQLMGNRSSNN